MSWPGLKLNFYKSTGIFNLSVCDHRETGNTTLLNSTSGIWNIGNNINIYDGNAHTLMAAWSMNDNSMLFEGESDSTYIVRNGLLIFDNIIYPNSNVNILGGKRTSLNFAYNELGQSTFLAIGGELQNQASSTSVLNHTEVANNFNGTIQDIVIWDRVLTSNDTAYFYEQMTNPWLAFYNNEDPLTGANLKSLSANVIAYYKLSQESLTGNSITAKDYSGTSNGGAQTNSATGNTLSFFGTTLDANNIYTIVDTNSVTQNFVHSSGDLQFSDENGITRKIGKIFYDLGILVFDNEYNNSSSGLPLLKTLALSGMSFAQNTPNFYINYMNFTSIENIERMNINLNATGSMMNFTENTTGIDETTGKQLLEEPACYVTSVALYNDKNEIMAIAKLNKAVRKDIDHDVNINVKLDF